MNRNIFFDFDGMKFDTLPAHILYINKRYGINTNRSDYMNKNNHLVDIIKKYKPGINLTRDDAYRDIGKNFSSSIEWHKDVKPMPGMCKVIKELSQEFTLWTVTARQKLSIRVIEYLLDKYLLDCINGIHCVWSPTENGNFKEFSKKKFIQSVPGYNIAFFDDSLNEIIETKDLLPSFLYDPECIHSKNLDIAKVGSWKEIGDIFL
jgi:hypothetical protein